MSDAVKAAEPCGSQTHPILLWWNLVISGRAIPVLTSTGSLWRLSLCRSCEQSRLLSSPPFCALAVTHSSAVLWGWSGGDAAEGCCSWLQPAVRARARVNVAAGVSLPCCSSSALQHSCGAFTVKAAAGSETPAGFTARLKESFTWCFLLKSSVGRNAPVTRAPWRPSSPSGASWCWRLLEVLEILKHKFIINVNLSVILWYRQFYWNLLQDFYDEK